jgi:hypothetical protein
MPAPAASGWSGRRAGLAPAGKAPPCHDARGLRTFGVAAASDLGSTTDWRTKSSSLPEIALILPILRLRSIAVASASSALFVV